MRRAVLLAGTRSQPDLSVPAALLPLDGDTVIGRLRRQLRTLDVRDIVVLARPEDARAFRDDGFTVLECDDTTDELRTLDRLAAQDAATILLCAADLVASATSIGTVLATADSQSAILAVSTPEGVPSPLQPPVVSQRGRLVRVELGAEPDSPAVGVFGGLIATDRRRLGAAVTACAARPELRGDEDVLTLVLREMAGTGEPVLVQRTPDLPSCRVPDAAAAAETSGALAAVDEDDVRLRLAVKRRDDLFATYCVSSFSPHLVRWAARLGLTPTAVTWASVGLALLAAAGFAQGTRPWLVAGAGLLYVSFVFDCVDGQLARYTWQYSRFGGWLDAIADRGKEYLVYGGLALGAARTGASDVWPLALAAMVLLTTRHMTDTWYGALQDTAVARSARQGEDRPGRPAAAPRSVVRRLISRVGALLGEASGKVQSNRGSIAYWLKRTVVLPIGERWMLVAVTVAVFDARVALLALLAWGAAAAGYTLLGRTLRTIHMRVPVMADVDRRLHRDDGTVATLLGRIGGDVVRPLPASLLPSLVAAAGVVAQLSGAPISTGTVALAAAAATVVTGLAAGHPHDGWLGWLIPAALRISEYSVLILFGWYAGLATPLLYALLAVVVLYHYDLTARLERSGSPIMWPALGLGWDGRIFVLGAATLLGLAEPVVVGLTVYLAALFVTSALAGVLTGRPHDDEGIAGASLPLPAEKAIPAETPEPV